MSNQPK
jgi:hypothetical protein